ncbi:MAG: hydrolase [Polymorphobacter sp.]|uniref:hydrolase n=1 Tax=Polymorphobacter sp. TaxID=1909290 RepID=UPI003A880FE5
MTITQTRATLAPDEAQALARLDGQRPHMVAQILDWASINSGSRNLAGIRAVADRVEAAFAPLGGEARRVAPRRVTSLDADGREVEIPHGESLHIVKRPEAPVRVLLTGHLDTVFPEDHPFQRCVWLDEHRLNGPGTADMKGGIAVLLAALETLEASPLAPRLGWEVVLVGDEEVSSLGSAALLAETAQRCHLGLTFEPALPDGTLAGARRGSGNFSAHVQGRAAHAGRNPEDGRNAVVAAADLALRLAALADEALSVNVARLDGGGPNNVVPESAVLRWNMRPATRADQARAEAGIAAAARATEAAHGVTICCHGHFARPPKPLDANQQRLFDLVRACGGALGLDLRWRDTGGVCDGNNLAATGLAVVDTLGPRGGAIHSPQEYLCADSLEERARLAALLLLRVARTGWVR